MIQLPWVVSVNGECVVTKLEATGTGTTYVEATYGERGVRFKPFWLDKDVAVVGQDQLRPDIVCCLDEQIADALRTVS